MGDIWQNWEEVVAYIANTSQGRRLFRSSAPNYTGTDASQNLTQAAVDILVQRKINRIVSFNPVPYTAAEMARLDAAGIGYLHLPVVDFKPATLAQLRQAIAFFKAAPIASTLVHCGYGWGRTGTGVTAIQLDATSGANPPESEWKSVNHVEEDSQVEVLRQLRDSYPRHDEL